MSTRATAALVRAAATLRDVDLELVRARNAAEAPAAVAWLEETFDARWDRAAQQARVASLVGWLASVDPELRVATVCVRPMLEVDNDPGAGGPGCPCTWDTRPQLEQQRCAPVPSPAVLIAELNAGVQQVVDEATTPRAPSLAEARERVREWWAAQYPGETRDQILRRYYLSDWTPYDSPADGS